MNWHRWQGPMPGAATLPTPHLCWVPCQEMQHRLENKAAAHPSTPLDPTHPAPAGPLGAPSRLFAPLPALPFPHSPPGWVKTIGRQVGVHQRQHLLYISDSHSRPHGCQS